MLDMSVLQCKNSSHNVKTSTSLLELGKGLFQPEVTPWPPWKMPGSSSELLLVPNLATLLFVGQCAALRFLDGSVNNLTIQLISCTQCILYQSKYLLLAVSEVIHFKSLMLNYF